MTSGESLPLQQTSQQNKEDQGKDSRRGRRVRLAIRSLAVVVVVIAVGVAATAPLPSRLEEVRQARRTYQQDMHDAWRADRSKQPQRFMELMSKHQPPAGFDYRNPGWRSLQEKYQRMLQERSKQAK